MPAREVVKLPAPVLKRRAEEIGSSSEDDLVRDLVDTMRASPACVGLAAPQIGVSRRAFVLDVTGHPKTTVGHGLVVMFDPEILETAGGDVGREGCMSVPDLTANVRRAKEIVVRGKGPGGEELVVATEGFEARVFQHEMDHLDGFLILDRVESLATDVFRRKVYR